MSKFLNQSPALMQYFHHLIECYTSSPMPMTEEMPDSFAQNMSCYHMDMCKLFSYSSLSLWYQLFLVKRKYFLSKTVKSSLKKKQPL